MMKTAVPGLFLTLCLCLFTHPCFATWSIVIADSETKEVVIGSVTCIAGIDLRSETPVILVGVGGGTVQAARDANGSRRAFIRSRLIIGIHPDQIITGLAKIAGHKGRQYGVADTRGRSATFTGGQVFTFSWAGGIVGRLDNLAYAIQGNRLAGSCVVPAMEQAVLNTPGDLPEKLMQAMLAARVTGGDGGCSCTTCSCPPSSFEKSGHVGYMIAARIGDANDPSCQESGCADGDYFMNLNVSFQTSLSPDPVFQLADLYQTWRIAHLGRPDAVRSEALLVRQERGYELTVQLRDWKGHPLATGTATVTVEHENDSDRVNGIGPVVDHGDGLFTVSLSPEGVGMDRFRISADDGVRPVVLMPSPRLCVGDVEGGLSADCNRNAIADECEIAEGRIADENGNGTPDPCEQFQRGDCDANESVVPGDALLLLRHMFDEVTAVVCQKACDANDDGALTLEDPFFILRFSLLSGPPPPPPFGECGFDPRESRLQCGPFGPCL